MSRSRAGLPLFLFILATASPVLAQADGVGTFDGMITKQRQQFGPPAPRKARCDKGNGDDIVVCAPDHGEDQRIPSSTETDPTSRAALRDGRPHAPQLDSGNCAKCPHFGKVPPPIYYFDIKALPEAPAGSDADKIAKGEAAQP